ncbi:hypothetical protein GLYMA_09G161800v4 [Glycine max]|uniref:Uncharacterized protein n=1 Tax=Glycine max TaxID=3847 RepID=A0A0R0I989_SOYBN|nr:hypothetical protein JHK85_025955 [Glycine max]KAG5013184.1 hypothetical protein JHK86_025445 [Glycine max]KAH1043273.1 hypothetical protein GYH30_025224 [Glycine max]KRH38844.1 hypothetical protein GLYMA_09G161800v4 [Glycine max]
MYKVASNFLILAPSSFIGRHKSASKATLLSLSGGPPQIGARIAKNIPRSSLLEPFSSKTERISRLWLLQSLELICKMSIK